MLGSKQEDGGLEPRSFARHPASRVVGVVLVVSGAVAFVLIPTLKGLSSHSLAQMTTVLALALLGAAAVTRPEEDEERNSRAVQIVLWSVAALAFVNLPLAWIDLDTWVWRAPTYFPVAETIGSDFRLGGYVPADTFSNAASGWPPFTVVLFLPYLLFGQGAAYVVHVVVLLLANLASIGLAVSLARSLFSADSRRELSQRQLIAHLGPVLLIWLFVSFGFLLSIERGNIDAFVAVLMMVALWSILRRPRDVWVPSIAIALATNIKVYPVVLLLVLVWRFRWRSLLPIVLCNGILAISAGPQNLVNYVRAMRQSMQIGASWVGNHSANSFSWLIDRLDPPYLPHVPALVLLLIPAVIFVTTVARLWRRADVEAIVLMTCCTLPMMCFVPSISHDYKTVLFAAPAVLLVGLLVKHVASRPAETWWMLMALVVALFYLGRAPGDLVDYSVPSDSFVWPMLMMNKYLPILLIQIVVAWMVWRLPEPLAPQTVDATAPLHTDHEQPPTKAALS